MEFTTNSNLYKWSANDKKSDTIVQMALNADKIDAQLAETEQQISGLQMTNAPTKDRMRNYMGVSVQRNPLYTIGDSIDEGSNTLDYTKDNWASIIRSAIQLESGNTNYGFCNFNTYVVDSSNTTIKTFHKITRSGFSVHANPFEPTAFGGTRITSVTANEYVDISYTGKDAIVIYIADATYGAVVEVSVDGEVVGTIDTKVTNGLAKASFSIPIAVSSFGEHTIRLKNTGGTAELCGMVYLDDASEYTPVVHNVGRSSITANEIPDELLELYASGGAVVLALGVNDQLLSQSVEGLKAKIRVVADAILANSGSLIICDFMFSLPPNNPYKVALSDVAKEYPNFIFLDFAKLWFQEESINKFSELLAADGVHPTVKGHEMIGNTLLKYMGLPYTKASIQQTEDFNKYIEDGNNPVYQYPILINGWGNYGDEGVHAQAKYYKDSNGEIKLVGLVKNGTTTPFTDFFILPEGYRPYEDEFFAASCDTGFARVTVTRGGNVQIVSGTNGMFSLSGIQFRAEFI